VLYRLPELLAADPAAPVYVVEGEKDADRLISEGLVATCNPQGAGKWRDEYSRHLRGRNVVVIPDNDDAGRRHANTVIQSLAGLAKAIKRVELPDLPPKGDVSDWLERHDILELRELVGSTPKVLTPDHLRKSEHLSIVSDHLREGGEHLREPRARRGLISLADVEPEEIRWLWHGRIAYGKLNVIDGDPGLGKSVMLLDLAARLTTGTPMPDSTATGRHEPANVLLMCAEDGLGDTIRPRLDAAGADITRVKQRDFYEDDRGNERLPILPDDIGQIITDILEHSAKLVVIDPIFAYIGAKISTKDDKEMRKALQPLKVAAEQTGAAIVVVRHLNKQASDNALYRGSASIAIAAQARSVLMVAPDPDDPTKERRIIAGVKSNVAGISRSMAYRVISGNNGAAQIQWEGDSNHTATSLLATAVEDRDRPAVNEAMTFLRQLLVDGPKPVTAIKKEARNAMISDIALRRGKDALGVIAVKVGFGEGAFWTWDFPISSHEDAHLHNEDDHLYSEDAHHQHNEG
jgi:putative DNA primase/helicase